MRRAIPWGLVALGLGLTACTGRAIVELDDGPFDSEGDSESETDGIRCGNGVAEDGEGCDVLDFRGQTCASLGYGSGTLRCATDCRIDLDGCDSVCGDGIVTGNEVCDGSSLDGQTCLSQGFAGGQLACLPSCDAFDAQGCVASAGCGNGVVEAPEVCDGADLAGQSCESLGLGAGQLVCLPGCDGFDAQGCGAGSCVETNLGVAVGPAVAMGNTSGEDDDFPATCALDGRGDHVLSFTSGPPGSYVFDTVGSQYDTALSIFASCQPSSELACNDDFGDSVQSQIIQPLVASQTVLVVVDGFGGSTGPWVLNITPPPLPPLPPCAELDLLWQLGSPVATGDTSFEDDDLLQSCDAGGAADQVLRFIAPTTGTFVFDTFGSQYDTVLSANTMCSEASELACNDDSDGTLQSRIVLDLTAGQSILLVVSGFAGDTGPWVLNIF